MGIFRRNTPSPITASAGAPNEQHISSITASANYSTGIYTAGGGGQNWQNASLDYIDRVPEHSYASAFVGWCLSRIQLRPGIIGDDLEITPLFDDEGKPRDNIPEDLARLANTLVSNLRSPFGGQAQLLWAMGELVASTGGCYLVGTDRVVKQQNSQGVEVEVVVARRWEVLSISEIRPRNDARDDEVPYKRYKTPGDQGTNLPPSSFVLRIHIPHLRYSELPRSSAQALLPTLEVLDLLTQESASHTRSRLAGPGILSIPSEIDLPPDPAQPTLEPFTARLITAMGTAIGDKSSAAGYVPLVIRPAYQYADRIQRFTFDTGEARTEERRAAKVGDYARGTDLPVEIVMGHANTTFSNAWAIDEATAKTHILPKVTVICGRLTNGYLQKLLMVSRGMDPDVAEVPPDIARIAIFPDISNLVVHPNREEIAKWAYGTDAAPNSVISASTARDWIGAGENDAPDEKEETLIRIARAQLLKQGGMNGVGADYSDSIPGMGPATTGNSGVAGSAVSSNGNRNGHHTSPSLFPPLSLQISIALEQAVERALDRIGARLRDKTKNDSAISPLLQGKPSSEIPRILGPDTVSRVIGPQGLFVGEFVAHSRLVERYARLAHHPNPVQLAAKSVELAEILTTRRMYEDVVAVDGDVVAGMVAGVK